jgi:hypothetical protein
MRVALLDGDDAEWMYPYGGRWWRRRAWMALPRPDRRHVYFKRELTPRTGMYRWYRVLPAPVAAALRTPRSVRPIAYSIPAEKVVAELPAKHRLIASHVVDPEVARRLSRDTGYAFESETDYYRDLRQSRFAITMKRSGWDCLRHYEIAANGCVPTFRDLDRKPPRCAPHGLDASNCVTYRNYDDLVRRLDAIDDEEYARLQRGALAWARANTTTVRAAQFLDEMGYDVGTAAEGERAARTST